jgi:hypothetical protein
VIRYELDPPIGDLDIQDMEQLQNGLEFCYSKCSYDAPEDVFDVKCCTNDPDEHG